MLAGREVVIWLRTILAIRQKNTSASDQHKRFVETARELGCDEDEAAFEEKLKRIATAKPVTKRASTLRQKRTDRNTQKP